MRDADMLTGQRGRRSPGGRHGPHRQRSHNTWYTSPLWRQKKRYERSRHDTCARRLPLTLGPSTRLERLRMQRKTKWNEL